MIYCHQLCFKMEEFSKRKQSDSYWSCKRNYWVSSITWITHLLCWLSLVIPSMGLHAIAWDQFARISPISASLNLFARALVTGPMGTWTGSEYDSSRVVLAPLLPTSSSFPSSWERFVLKSSPASNGLRSETLNVALPPYSPGRSNLYALSLILSRI